MPDLLDQFSFDLPDSLIAQQPLERRADARLMVLRRGREGIAHHVFRELPGLLPADAVVVVNNTRVLPRRLSGRLPGGTAVEALLVAELGDGTWSAMVKRGRRVRPGMAIAFAEGELPAEAVRRTEEGHWVLRFADAAALPSLLERYGLAPLPPYIRRDEVSPCQASLDREAYQTCYAKVEGAIAAPTAGLHFVPEVLEALRERGLTVAELTLHVGLGTFTPVKVGNPELHKMHGEWYEIPEPAAATINEAMARRRPVIAVGTTTVRALESWAAEGCPPGLRGWSELFIRPPFSFRVVDGLITNFHQPRSTLLMMVSAFHGLQPLLDAYREAIASRYRFFSYGDCMAILPHGA
jgi:S-adenosylmethionine:tRNA ribosyltransferase-isomerase